MGTGNRRATKLCARRGTRRSTEIITVSRTATAQSLHINGVNVFERSARSCSSIDMLPAHLATWSRRRSRSLSNFAYPSSPSASHTGIFIHAPHASSRLGRSAFPSLRKYVPTSSSRLAESRSPLSSAVRER